MKKYLSLVLALVMLLTAIPLTGITAFAAVKGDGNGDGKVSSLDARLALQVAADLKTVSDEAKDALDMDENGKISSLDARKILQVVAGLDDSNSDEDTDNTDQESLRDILRLFGYEYDASQNIYYTHLNPWQRYFGFADIYDNAAAYVAMRYLTLKIDFEYGDLLWRLQWWKGQYGVLEGAELGVYTKNPANIDSPFYKCAEDEHLLKMYFEYYESVEDYNNDNMLFMREEQDHWWLTGFKFGVCDPMKNVIKATLIAWDEDMADGIEEGLKNVTDKEGNWNGFVKYRPWLPVTSNNFYTREKLDDGTYKFTVVWKDAGYLNYGEPENPEEVPEDEPTTDPIVPEEPSTDPVVPEEPSTDPIVPEEPSTDPVVPEEPSTEPVVPEEPSTEAVIPEEETE